MKKLSMNNASSQNNNGHSHFMPEKIELSTRDFNCLRQLVGKHTGISLSDEKNDLVNGRLSKRLRALGMSGFGEYCELMTNNPGDELEHFTNAITTNLTSFFREDHHFKYLAQEIVPLLLERYNKTGRLRIWSAGCSTGEEPYSLAMTLYEAIPDVDKKDIRILATDLDTNVVQVAAQGIYDETLIEGLSNSRRKQWFQRGMGAHAGKVKVVPALQKLITFKQLNLMKEWPMQGLFDVIFCRNVVIYFDKPTQTALFDRFASIMQPDSHLIIGHSETLNQISDRFALVDKTIYRRTR